MNRDKYILLYSNIGLYCDTYDTYEEAYAMMKIEFEKSKESIQKEYDQYQMIWFINECTTKTAILETLDGKFSIKWKIVKLTKKGQIVELPLFIKEKSKRKNERE